MSAMLKLLKKAKCITLQLLWNAHIEVVDLFLAWVMFAWGLWVMLPFNTFRIESFREFAAYFPEPVWGVVYMLAGLAGIIGVLTYNYSIRRIHSVVAIFLWLFICVAFVSSNPATTGVVTYGSFALAQMWLFVRQKFTSKKNFAIFNGGASVGTVNNIGECIDRD